MSSDNCVLDCEKDRFLRILFYSCLHFLNSKWKERINEQEKCNAFAKIGIL